MKKQIIVVGGFHEIFELCALCGYEVSGYIDKDMLKTGAPFPWIGDDNNAERIYRVDGRSNHIVISPDKPSVREKLFHLYGSIGFKFVSLVSPHSLISPSAIIEEGCVIQSFCNVSSNAVIGKGVKMNTAANVMHDVVVAEFATIAPGATILGNVHIGRKAYIGAGATILPGVAIGAGAIVGAGAVVTKNVAEGITVVGIPASMKRLTHKTVE